MPMMKIEIATTQIMCSHSPKRKKVSGQHWQHSLAHADLCEMERPLASQPRQPTTAACHKLRKLARCVKNVTQCESRQSIPERDGVSFFPQPPLCLQNQEGKHVLLMGNQGKSKLQNCHWSQFRSDESAIASEQLLLLIQFVGRARATQLLKFWGGQCVHHCTLGIGLGCRRGVPVCVKEGKVTAGQGFLGMAEREGERLMHMHAPL